MSANDRFDRFDKFFWDEVMNGIDEKFTDEAAELMLRQKGGKRKKSDDEYPETVEPTLKIKLAPEEQRPKRRVIGGICAGVAVAAAVAIAVGVFAVRKSDDLVSDADSGTQSGVNLIAETSGTEVAPNISFDAKLDTDINSYTLDFGLYERYFHGIWQTDSGVNYIGYTPAELPERMKISLGSITHIGFKQADGGCYMGIFSGAYEQFFYVSDNDPDIMRSNRFDRDSGAHYISELSTTISRKGDFEEKGNALNCMGILKIFAEYGVDPDLIVKSGVLIKGADEYTLINSSSKYGVLNDLRFNGERENESGQKQLCFSANLYEFPGTNYDCRFMPFCVTQTDDGGWSAPELCADYNPESDDTPVFPDGLAGADGMDFGMLEDTLAGGWTFEEHDRNGYTNIYYNNLGNYVELEPVWKSCFEDESGRYFLCGDTGNIVYFVPKADPDTLYVYLDRNSAKDEYSLVMYRGENVKVEPMQLSGELTYTGEQYLFNVMGDDFKDALLKSSLPYREGESPQNQYFNGLHYTYNKSGINVLSLSENEALLAVGFDREKDSNGRSEGEQLLMWKFFRKDGKWDYYEPQLYIEGDYTGVSEECDEKDNWVNCSIYEKYFFGDWICDADGSVLSLNYTDDVFSEYYAVNSVFKGNDGWYIYGGYDRKAVYYIPFYDENSMYFYDLQYYGWERKCDYTKAYRRDTTVTDFDTELKDGMNLCDMGLEKLYGKTGEGFERAYKRARNLGFIDDSGSLWRSTGGKVRLVKYDVENVTLACEFFDTGSDASREYQINLTSPEYHKWEYSVSDGSGKECDLFDPYENKMFSEIVDAYTSAYPDKTEEIYDTVERVVVGQNFWEFNTGWLYTTMYSSLDTLVQADYSAQLTESGEIAADDGKPLPTRGKITMSDIERLTRGNRKLRSIVLETLFVEGWEGEDGSIWSAFAGADDDIYLVRNSDSTLTLLVPFRCTTNGKVKYRQVTFDRTDPPGHFYTDTLNNVDFTYTGDKIEVEGGYYFLVDVDKLDCSGDSLTLGNPDKNAKAAVYFYDEDDGIYYSIFGSNTWGLYNPRCVTDGKNLFVLAEDFYDEYPDAAREIITVASYGGGYGLWGHAYFNPVSEFGGLKYNVTTDDIYFLGDYLVGEYSVDGEKNYSLFTAYGPSGPKMLELDNARYIQGTDLKVDESGFTLNVEGEEMRFDTTGNDLEGMYPLLKGKYTIMREALQINPYMMFDSRSENDDWGEVVCSDSTLFPDYKAFREWVGGTIAEEYIDSVLDSCDSKPTDIDGLMYYNKISNVSGNDYSRFILTKIDYSDDDHAVLNFDIYGYQVSPDNALEKIPTDEPVDTCTLTAVKTESGWRFTDISAPIE